MTETKIVERTLANIVSPPLSLNPASLSVFVEYPSGLASGEVHAIGELVRLYIGDCIYTHEHTHNWQPTIRFGSYRIWEKKRNHFLSHR